MAFQDKTTIQISRTVRFALEVLRGRYQANSVSEALERYFNDNEPNLIDDAKEVERIMLRPSSDSDLPKANATGFPLGE